MGSKCIPVKVRSGVTKDSEEGTEIIVKRTYIEKLPPKKTVLYYMGIFLSFVGLIWWFLYTFRLLMTWPRWVRDFGGFWDSFVYGFLGFIPMAVGSILYRIEKRRAKPIEVEKEKLIPVFFPRVFITDINDVKGIYPQDYGSEEMSRDEGTIYNPFEMIFFNGNGKWLEIDSIWRKMGWDHVLKANHARGEVWVESYDQRGERYLAKFYSPDLCKRVKHAWEVELKQALFEGYREKLEYLERVGRYEEAARLYEKLGMLEKAGEMRRKKREATVVRLDLNALIRELAERGFTVTYHCSHCGAPIRVSGETNVEDVKVCSHCGSRIEVIDLARFIRSKLS